MNIMLVPLWRPEGRARMLPLAFASALVLAGCSKKPTPAAGPPKPAIPAAGITSDTNTPMITNLFVSVFVDQPGSGRDPFFPKSLRRKAVEVKPGVTATDTKPVAAMDFSTAFVLRGFVGDKVATINNRTLAVGESAMVHVMDERGQVREVRVKLLSIKGATCRILMDNDPEPREITKKGRLN